MFQEISESMNTFGKIGKLQEIVFQFSFVMYSKVINGVN